MTQNPHCVADYIQYDDNTPFQPLQLQYDINDLVKTYPMYGEITVIVRYWLRYKQGNKRVTL